MWGQNSDRGNALLSMPTSTIHTSVRRRGELGRRVERVQREEPVGDRPPLDLIART